MRQQAASAHEALTRAVNDSLGELVRAEVQALLDRWGEIESAARVTSDRGIEGLVKTRLHGDLHLGQVVVVRDDFHILDFEGEPLRPLSERRVKSSPLRDVAGMLRSFDYAASTALHRRPEVRPGGGEVLRRALLDWRHQVIGQFLEGYRTAIAGCPSVPAAEATFRSMLDLFLLEKVLYEIRYEAANRPDWLIIPVGGLRALLDRISVASELSDRPLP